MVKKLLYLFLVLLPVCSFSQTTKQAYINISGTVYDISARIPIEAVVVQSTRGNGVLTDSLGRYSILVRKTDSIWFSMLGKSTTKFSVDTIANPDEFNIMIHYKVSDLPEVKVRTKNYKLDSIENRKDYAKVFNFRKPGIKLNENYSTGVGVGFDLQEIVNMFRFKYNKSMLKLQARLLQQERDKYIDYRFTKLFVKRLTKLQGAELESFMQQYRPSYEFLLTVNDIELGYFIERDFEQYKIQKAMKH